MNGQIASLALDERSRSGRAAMRLAYTRNEQAGGGTVAFPERGHVFTRYYEFWDEGFDFACGQKVHRLSGFNSAAQLNHFDIIAVQFGAGSASGARNHCGVNDVASWAVAYNGGPVDWGTVGFGAPVRRPVGRWSCWEYEIKLNTPGARDGEVRVWLDGTLRAERRGVDLRGRLAAGINRVLFGGWYSNGCTGQNPCLDPVRPSLRYIDDVVVAAERVGCR